MTALKGPYPDESPFGSIGTTGSPLAYSIDPGAGSASDRVTRYWPDRRTLDDIHERGGDITPLYATAPADVRHEWHQLLVKMLGFCKEAGLDMMDVLYRAASEVTEEMKIEQRNDRDLVRHVASYFFNRDLMDAEVEQIMAYRPHKA